MNPTKRKYTISDANMIQHSNTMLQHFADETAAFTAYDPDFGATYGADWKILIEAAASQPTDESMMDQLEELTVRVNEAMDKCLEKFRNSRHFIEKAFPNRPARHKEFGFDDLQAVRKSQTGMIQFMRTFFATATKYAAELDAANYDAAAIADIDVLRNNLEKADTEQEKFKGTREDVTEQRVLAMNAAWDRMVVVSKAGKAIFFKDAPKYHWFLLPASSIAAEELSITGTVTDQNSSAPIENASITLQELGITVSSDSTGKYGFTIVPAGTYTIKIEAPGYTTRIITELTVEDNGTPTVQDIQLEPVV